MIDAEVRSFVTGLGLPGLVDIHVHFMPESVLRKVWAYFDNARANYGVDWPIQYRFDEDERLRLLRSFGVVRFAPLAYPHKPGMAEWLNEWIREFAARVPDAVPTATLFPEPGVTGYVEKALDAGTRCVKAHVQIGGYDPRTSELDEAWGLIVEAGVPAVVHCGHGPLRGSFTGLGLFEQVLRRHPRLTLVLAHAGMPEYVEAFDLVRRYPNVYLDTTMVGVRFGAPLPADFVHGLAEFPDRVALGTDFPNIPYEYAHQLEVIAGWAEDPRLGPDFLKAVLHDTPARLLRLPDDADGR
ncbi:putative TIM-barrel fold metal-dependent hydrolase [Kibdelosporangium banguiense]|uniref:TIM-barrel fold metal-dependent hydrolase n=1 Tax=Kibdelosporangium banguiense TaxID=1365924 RepID=A0ABS4T9D2_9PSEU|nr:amidohydrolase family protein [Kibdelosporangium banguiense]MBP2320544.1 putative TIM-barrel fold metal-dependent hydrolase [Kibdelosporangium banguiense]